MIWTLLQVTPVVGKQPGLQAGVSDSRRAGMWCQDREVQRRGLSPPRISSVRALMPKRCLTGYRHHSLFSSCEQCLAGSLPSVSASLINSLIENRLQSTSLSLLNVFLFLLSSNLNVCPPACSASSLLTHTRTHTSLTSVPTAQQNSSGHRCPPWC